LTKDKRRFPRFNVKWPVVIENGDRMFKGEMHIMSANGGSIRSEQSLEPDKTIHLTIDIPDGASLVLDARVVWSVHAHSEDEKYPYSIGVQFENQDRPE
jgi:hypothetical protein